MELIELSAARVTAESDEFVSRLRALLQRQAAEREALVRELGAALRAAPERPLH